MKLVDILARGLKDWPEGTGIVGQARDGTLHLGHAFLGFNGWTKEKYTMGDDWNSAHVTRTQWQAAVDALKAEKVVDWDGEGLPPVGTVCEMRFKTDQVPEWSRIEVLYSGARSRLFNYIDDCEDLLFGHEDFASMQFRPNRTPEQITAEEKITATTQMLIDGGFKLDQSECVSRLYSAGWRKQDNGLQGSQIRPCKVIVHRGKCGPTLGCHCSDDNLESLKDMADLALGKQVQP